MFKGCGFLSRKLGLRGANRHGSAILFRILRTQISEFDLGETDSCMAREMTAGFPTLSLLDGPACPISVGKHGMGAGLHMSSQLRCSGGYDVWNGGGDAVGSHAFW